MYTRTPHYQQSTGLQGHMVTEWAVWLQVCIPWMPVGLGLQMSLSLLTLRINISLSLSHLFLFIRRITLLFSLLSFFTFTFNLISLSETLLLISSWCSQLSLVTHIFLLTVSQWTHRFVSSMPSAFFLLLHLPLSLPAWSSSLYVSPQRERWAMERRTGPVLSPVKRERVDTKYRPPSQPL